MSRQAYAEVATYVDPESGDLRPADQAEVFVYLAGTTKLASIYESRTGSTLRSNPFLTGSNGMAQFWAADGDYDLKFHDTKAPTRFGDYTIGWQSSPVDTEIGVGELSDKGDLSWTQDPETGAWIPQLVNNAVETPNIKDAAVTEPKLAAGAATETKHADGSVTSRKFKPTAGIIQASGGLTLTESYQDVPGGTLNITPAVASKIEITAIFSMYAYDTMGLATAEGTIKLNSEAEQTATAKVGVRIDVGSPTSVHLNSATASQVYLLNLTAAAHVIKMRAKRTGEAGGLEGPETRMLYRLFAQ